MECAIEISNISKVYPKATEHSLQNVSFKINPGDKLGIFGPNGAGKTTLISILCRIIPKSEGSVMYNDDQGEIDIKSFLFKMGYVPQDYSFYEELSPVQNLMYFGSLYGIEKNKLKSKISHLLDVLGLSHVSNNRISTFSGGMKRRVNLAIGIINDPKILFLDEPTVGVDVQSKNAIMAYLETLNQNGTTIVYTSHHMNEGQEFCNRIILMDNGQLIANNTLNKLLSEHNKESLEELFLELTGIAYRD